MLGFQPLSALGTAVSVALYLRSPMESADPPGWEVLYKYPMALLITKVIPGLV